MALNIRSVVLLVILACAGCTASGTTQFSPALSGGQANDGGGGGGSGGGSM